MKQSIRYCHLKSHLCSGHLGALSLDGDGGRGVGSAKELFPIQRLGSSSEEAFEKALFRRLWHLHSLL